MAGGSHFESFINVNVTNVKENEPGGTFTGNQVLDSDFFILYVISKDMASSWTESRTAVVVYECKWVSREVPVVNRLRRARRKYVCTRNSHVVGGQMKDLIRCEWTTCNDERRCGNIP